MQRRAPKSLRGPLASWLAAGALLVLIAVLAAAGALSWGAEEVPRETPLEPLVGRPWPIGPGEEERTPVPARVVGRVVSLPEGIARHQWPGVYAEVRFEGDALLIGFDDAFNRYRLIVDGRLGGIIDRPGQQMLRFDALGAGPHEARLEKLSESLDHSGAFGGFFVPTGGAALAPPRGRSRQLEFIGDSDTVGYGNLSPRRDCPGEKVFELTDVHRAFGPQVARHFNADFQLLARSGAGLVRNMAGRDPGRAMIHLHDRILPDEPEAYDRSGWDPQVIVIVLGPNDFADVSPTEPWSDRRALRAAVERGFAELLDRVRAQSPRALVIVGVYKNLDADYTAAMREVARAIEARGDPRLQWVLFPKLDYRGCHWHPSPRDHRALAETLIRTIEARPEIWDAPRASP